MLPFATANVPLAPLIVFIPLLVAVLLAALTKLLRPSVTDYLTITTAAVVEALCVLLLLRARRETIVHWFGGWQPRGGVALGIAFVVDPFGAACAVFAALLVLAALIFSSRYFEKVGTLYHVLMLVFLGAMCGFSLTGDLFNLFVFFELMSAAAFALCGYKTEEPAPLQGALNFAVTNTVGALFVLHGIALIYARTGALNLAQAGRTLAAQPLDGLVIAAFVLITVGFLVKAAVVPFHFWLADAHAVAPTPVCVLFSGIMVELGLYAVARIYWTIFAAPLGAHAAALRAVLVGAGVLTALVGALMCFAQHHLKRLLAFSTVSHMGLMLIGFALLAPGALAGLAIYAAGHGLVKSSLFLGAGILLHRFGSVDEIKLRGRGRRLYPLAGIFLLGALGLAGLPSFGTFLGETLMLGAAKRESYSWLTALTMVTEVLTGAAVLRVTFRIFAGWGTADEETPRESALVDEERETRGNHRRTPFVMLAPALALALMGLVVGLIPGLRAASDRAAQRMRDQTAYAARVLEGVAHAVPKPEREESLLPEIARGMGAAGGACLLALLTLFRDKLRVKRWLLGAQSLMRGVEWLRRLHSGQVGDYVMWLIWGAAALGAFFAVLLR